MTSQTASRADVFDQVAVVGKAFASAKRLELIDVLAQGEHTVEVLSQDLGLGVSTVSAHLQILKMSNLVRTRREGTRVYYRLAGDDIAELYAVLRRVAVRHSAEVARALESYLGTGDVEELGAEDLLQRLGDEDLLLLDVRPREEFDAAHIPGAVPLPLGDLLEAVDSIDPQRQVVAYCRGAYCVLAHDAVRLLAGHGRPARRLRDGMFEWRVAGHPVTTGEQR